LSEILLGTSGWSYAEWEDILYTTQHGKLKQYSSVFPTVEINSTFYALPKPETVFGWAKHTPLNFIYSAKLLQIITHKKTLDPAKGVENDLIHFLDVLRPLIDAKKLICILIQLPPFLKFDINRLESFLSLLPKDPYFAVEFRHTSWLQNKTFHLLEKYQVAYTIVDEPLIPPYIHVTSDIAYFRWHGRGSKPWFNYKYSEEELHHSIPRVKKASEQAKKIIGYFNNHFHGYAPENCLQIMQMLGNLTPIGSAAYQRITSYRKKKHSSATSKVTLEAWTRPLQKNPLEKLILQFSEKETIKRAEEVSQSKFSLREDSKHRVAAYVENTTVDIDFDRQQIIHYCPIWSKTSREKKYCPHIIKLLLELNEQRSLQILSLIHSHLTKWQFKSKFSIEFPE
jgi:uncharacterized protein YecE (DUF72 family)